MALISVRDSAHDFIVKFRRNGYTEFLLTLLIKQQTVTNPAVLHGLCAMTRH